MKTNIQTARLITLVLLFVVCCAFRLQKDKQLDIVFIGDSITYGAGLKDPGQQAPPVVTANYLRRHGYSQISIANCGVGGHTTLDFLPGSSSFQRVAAAAADFAKDPEAGLLFSLMLGTNDSALKGPNGAPVAAESYRSNLHLIIDSLLSRFPQSHIVIHHPLWYSSNVENKRAFYGDFAQTRLQSYLQVVDQLVMDYRRIAPGKVYQGDTNGFQYFKKHHLEMLQPETWQGKTFYLHPNEKGAAKLGDLWGTAMVSALAKPVTN